MTLVLLRDGASSAESGPPRPVGEGQVQSLRAHGETGPAEGQGARGSLTLHEGQQARARRLCPELSSEQSNQYKSGFLNAWEGSLLVPEYGDDCESTGPVQIGAPCDSTEAGF